MKKLPKVHAIHKEQMKAIRIEMRFSLRDLAAVTGISYRTLQDYEGGQRSIPDEVAVLLHDLLAEQEQIREEIFAGIEARVDNWFLNRII